MTPQEMADEVNADPELNKGHQVTAMDFTTGFEEFFARAQKVDAILHAEMRAEGGCGRCDERMCQRHTERWMEIEAELVGGAR